MAKHGVISEDVIFNLTTFLSWYELYFSPKYWSGKSPSQESFICIWYFVPFICVLFLIALLLYCSGCLFDLVWCACCCFGFFACHFCSCFSLDLYAPSVMLYASLRHVYLKLPRICCVCGVYVFA